MIKKLSLLILTAATIAFIVVSCQKEPTSGNYPGGAGGGSAAGNALTRVAEQMGKDMGEFLTNEGTVAIMAVSSKIKNSDAFNFGGFGSSKSNNNRSARLLKKLSNTVKRSVLFAALPRYVAHKYSDNFNKNYTKSNDEDSTRFNFSEHTGIYQYNENTEEWEKVGSSNYIIFIMNVEVPDPQDTSIHYTKQARLTIYYWNEQRFEYTNEEGENVVQWMPTGVKIDLTLDNELVAALNYNATFNPTTRMPLNLTLSLQITPFALNVNYVDGGQNITGSITLTKNGAIMLGFGASLDFFGRSAGDAINVDEEDNIPDTQIKYLSAWAQFSTMRITLTVNVENMENISDPTPAQLNDNVQVVITDNGQLIGHIEFYYEDDCQQECDMKFRIIFEDGGTGNIDDYFGDIINQIDSLIGDDDNDSNNRVIAHRPIRNFRR